MWQEPISYVSRTAKDFINLRISTDTNEQNYPLRLDFLMENSIQQENVSKHVKDLLAPHIFFTRSINNLARHTLVTEISFPNQKGIIESKFGIGPNTTELVKVCCHSFSLFDYNVTETINERVGKDFAPNYFYKQFGPQYYKLVEDYVANALKELDGVDKNFFKFLFDHRVGLGIDVQKLIKMLKID